MIVYQTENFGKRYEYRSNPHHGFVVPPHIHEYSEIAFTKSGVTTVLVDGQKYALPPNHLILILPNQIHEYTDETTSFMRCAVFSNDHTPAFFERIRGLCPADPVVDLTDHKTLLEELDALDPADTLRVCGLLNLLCDLVLKACTWVPTAKGEHSLFYEVTQYLSQNFREDIRLCDLAKRLGYHEKYLSSALHALTGMNFRTFLASYRIDLAKDLLGAGKLRVADIALQCGFSSINSFNRAFLRITGTTPTAYRARRGDN